MNNISDTPNKLIRCSNYNCKLEIKTRVMFGIEVCSHRKSIDSNKIYFGDNYYLKSRYNINERSIINDETNTLSRIGGI